jgi:hypothetical protein
MNPDTQNNSKSCGGCTACCTIMGVAQLNKPHYIPCEHICPLGCAIYESKPSACHMWECAWKSGWIYGDVRRRPDKLGVMFEFRIVGGSSFLWAYEVWPGAFTDPKVNQLLRRLQRKELLVMCRHGSMNITADSNVLEFLKEHGCGTKDYPLVPIMNLGDESGVVIGKRITKRVGNKFIVEQNVFDDIPNTDSNPSPISQVTHGDVD